MTKLLLAPHYDDESLFAAYTILRHQPWVVTVYADAQLQAQRGGPDEQTRFQETKQALGILGAQGWSCLPVRDDKPDPDMLYSLLTEIYEEQPWTHVFAPAYEEGGHEQHNLLAQATADIFREIPTTWYLTYRRGYGRSWSHNEVEPKPDWPALKFAAMACYASQINLPDCQPWFAADDSLREWYADGQT